ncbi:MAG: DUF3127 domain-containing protein [Bacteroidales bacterium]
MAIEIKCNLVSKLQVQNGSSARGPWSKQDFIVETQETYPKKICMNVWGADKVLELGGYNTGEELTVSVNIESREFNGRWYTDVRAWKIQRGISAAVDNAKPIQPVQQGDPFMNTVDNNASKFEEEGEDDLPF